MLTKHVIIGLFLTVVPASAQDPVDRASCPTVTAVGDAVILELADRAFVTVSTEARAKQPEDAQQQIVKSMAAVIARLKALGFSDNDIRTVRYELRPQFDYIDGKQIRRGYVAVNASEVRIDDLSRIGSTIDAAVEAGANVVREIRFDLRNREALEREALKRAVTDARASTDAAAAGVGMSIERITRIDERDSGPRPPVPMMMAARSDENAVTPVMPSPIEVRASVTLSACMR